MNPGPVDGAAQRIETQRLSLELLAPPALRAIAEGRLDEASEITGCDLASFPEEERGIAAIRFKDLAADPGYLPWSLRLLRLKPDLRFAGYFNFHTRPDPDYLRALAPGAVEFGYFVLPGFRRRGLAEETALGMMDWAARRHGIDRFVVSVSPDNAPSVAMARKLGFARIGSHIDETDGYEDILSLDISSLARPA
jgi:RimJ/RimL family protein N-acetyltransferase